MIDWCWVIHSDPYISSLIPPNAYKNSLSPNFIVSTLSSNNCVYLFKMQSEFCLERFCLLVTSSLGHVQHTLHIVSVQTVC